MEGARASAQRRHQTPGAQRARLALAHKMLRGGLMLPPVIELHHADGLARILRKTFFLISNVYLLTFFLVLLEILWGKMNWRKDRIQVSFLICFSKQTQEKNVNFNLENLCEWCYSTGELTERCVSVVFTTASPTGHITSGTSRSRPPPSAREGSCVIRRAGGGPSAHLALAARAPGLRAGEGAWSGSAPTRSRSHRAGPPGRLNREGVGCARTCRSDEAGTDPTAAVRSCGYAQQVRDDAPKMCALGERQLLCRRGIAAALAGRAGRRAVETRNIGAAGAELRGPEPDGQWPMIHGAKSGRYCAATGSALRPASSARQRQHPSQTRADSRHALDGAGRSGRSVYSFQPS